MCNCYCQMHEMMIPFYLHTLAHIHVYIHTLQYVGYLYHNRYKINWARMYLMFYAHLWSVTVLMNQNMFPWYAVLFVKHF